MTSRTIEAIFLAIMALAILVGGQSLLVSISAFRSLAIVLLVIAFVFIVYAFRQNYRASRPGARLAASRDTAFLATIIAAISYIATHAHWALGATVVGLEVGIVLEFLSKIGPAPRDGTDPAGTQGS